MRETGRPARDPGSGLTANATTRRWPLAATAAVFLSSLATGWSLGPLLSLDTSQIIHVPFTGTALHNLRVIFLIVLGGFLLGIPSLTIAFWNGMQAGMLLSALEPRFWPSLAIHGAPELAGQFVATLASLGLGRGLFRRVVHEEPVEWRPVLKQSLIAVLLTVAAAGIESRITPIIATGVQG